VLYLMIGGITSPRQSHVTNLRVHLRYATDKAAHVELVPPLISATAGQILQ